MAGRVSDGAAARETALPLAAPQPQATAEEKPTTPLVGRGLAALANQKGGALQIRLDPPSLGDLRIAMTVVNGKVSAELTTSTGQAHALLSADLTALRQALEAQGLSVERLSIQHAPQEQNQQHLPTARAEATPAQGATAQQPGSSQQQSFHGDANGNDRNQQQRHDASHGQSRGRSSQGGDGNERDPGSKSRRRASFARVFAASNLP